MALAWRRVDDGASTDIEGLTGDRLRAVAALWKQTRREIHARFGGSSMAPTIAPGAEVVVRCGTAPSVGEIVAYVHGDQVVVHRVVALSASRGLLLTRGDAHAIPDLPVRDPADVIGVVVGIRRDGGLVAPEAPPRSLARSLALALTLNALRLHPLLGRLAIRGLRWRRWPSS